MSRTMAEQGGDMSFGRLSENEQAQLIRLRRKKAALTMVIRALERYTKISVRTR
jgi:hypothetical protein